MLAAAAALLIGAAALPALPQAEGFPLERAVKATYLWKFGPFITWPQTALAGPDSTIHLCVAGEDPFGAVLDEALAGQSIEGHPILLRRLARVDRQSACHILFAAGSPEQSVAEALEAVRGTPVLTFTDAARAPQAKGIVHFVMRDERVRFEIDEYAAAENGLAISSKVLSLAVSVRSRLK